MKRIEEFSGKYRFLSNFYTAPFTMRPYLFRHVDGSEHRFQTAEHAYQCAKPVTGEEVIKIATATTAGKAKQMGNRCSLRADWDEIKIEVMRGIVREKFRQNPKLAEKLTDTFPAELIEGNNWNGVFWGVCRGKGHNWLGVILEEVRLELI